MKVKVKMNENSPLDYADLYLTNDFWYLLVVETNRFAQQFFEKNANNSSRRLWNPVDIVEMKTFIGLILLMGIIHKPSNESQSFYLILRFLHFNDNEAIDLTDEYRDHLHKIRPLIDVFRKRYFAVHNLSVDESLVLFKGRLKFRQYIRTKRARFGIKFYELCTSEGITLDFLFYCGKDMFQQDDPYENMSASERIPAVLMRRYLGKRTHIVH